MPALPSPTYRLATFKPWYERMPVRTRQIVVVAAVGVVAFVLILLVIRWHHRSQPGYVLEVLDHAGSPAEVQRQGDYFTPQGKEVWLWLLKQAADKPRQKHKVVVADPVVSGTTCDVRIDCEEVTMTVRLVNNGRWQFHDLRLDKAGDQKIDLWVSYAKDHPYRVMWKLHWREFVDAFVRGTLMGVKIGSGLGR